MTLELEPVPTVHELWGRGLADVVAWTKAAKAAKPTHFRIKPEGQQLIYDAMARNARKAREDDERQRQAQVRREGTAGEPAPIDSEVGAAERAASVPAPVDDGLPY